MPKKGKKTEKISPIESLAAKFDDALFDEIVRTKENKLRDKYAKEGISKRLHDLTRTYGSVDLAYRILAEEKIYCKIRQVSHPNESEGATKSFARVSIGRSHAHQLRQRHPSHKVVEADSPHASMQSHGGGWRTWGYGTS